jgi:hypothetical protein
MTLSVPGSENVIRKLQADRNWLAVSCSSYQTPPVALTGMQQSLLGTVAIGDTWVRSIPSEARASIDILDDRQRRGLLDVGTIMRGYDRATN